MNILGNVKLFAIVGVVAAAAMVAAALLTTQDSDPEQADPLPSATPTATIDPSATPTATIDPSATPSPTEEVLQWAEPDQVIDAAAFTYSAVVETSKGEFTIELDAENAPNTVNSFVFLAENDYFDGIAFHRIVENFVVQGGDPTGTGSGGPGYTVQDEPNEISNTKYTVSMAKSRGASSFGSQFFINLKDNTGLDYTSTADKFYPFGKVVDGMDVVDEIGLAGSPDGTPKEEITIVDVRIEQETKN
jgi:cyclophilin family peptidyl-prolyl cis-trans isomerase